MTLLTPTELTTLAKSEKDARKKIRLIAVAHFSEGHNRTQIAHRLKASRRMVNQWVANYLKEGIKGLESKKPTGRHSYLSPEQQQQLCRYIEQQSQSSNGGRLTGDNIKQYIQGHFGIFYHPNAIYKLLSSLGFSWITSRSRHPKQSREVQESFKNTVN